MTGDQSVLGARILGHLDAAEDAHELEEQEAAAALITAEHDRRPSRLRRLDQREREHVTMIASSAMNPSTAQ